MTDLRTAAQQALEALEQDNPSGRTATITALRAALAQEPEPVQEPSYEPKFFDTVLYTGSSERVTVVSSVSSVSSVSVPTQPYRVLTDADLDAIRKIVREGEEK